MKKEKILYLFRGEVYFALFSTAVYFKEGLTFLPSYLDLTLIFFVLSVCAAVFRMYKNKTISKGAFVPVLLFGCFIFVAFISYTQTPSVVYANEKLLKIVVIMGWAVLGPVFLLRTKKSWNIFLKSIAFVGLVVACFGLYEFFIAITSGSYYGRLIILNSSYLSFGRIVGMATIIIIGLLWIRDMDTKLRKMDFLWVIILITSMLFAGGRMGIIGLITAILTMTFLNIRFLPGAVISYHIGIKKVIKLAAVTVAGVLMILYSGNFNNTVERFSSLLGGEDSSTLIRMGLYDLSYQMFLDNPLFGQGLASFPMFYRGIDEKSYPHNLFLELLSELGLVGFIPLVFLFVYSLFNALFVYKKKHGKFDSTQTTIFGLFIFFLLNVNSTGDITDNRMLFTFMVMMSISPYLIKPKEKETINTSKSYVINERLEPTAKL